MSDILNKTKEIKSIVDKLNISMVMYHEILELLDDINILSNAKDSVIKISFKEQYQNKIKEIATNYHDRIVVSMCCGDNFICKCCERKVYSLTSIEHDSGDYSKDLSVCTDCYIEISNYWRKNKLKKYLDF